MCKLSKSMCITAFVSLVVIVALLITLVCVNHRKNHWQNQAGEYNLHHWNILYSVVETIDRSGYTVENLKDAYPYINSLIGVSFSPEMKGTETVSTFLGGYYDPFLQKLTSQSLTEAKQKEGLLLLETINKEWVLLMHGFIDTQKKAELVDNGSEEYIQASEKLTAFCNKYCPQIVPYVEG